MDNKIQDTINILTSYRNQLIDNNTYLLVEIADLKRQLEALKESFNER